MIGCHVIEMNRIIQLINNTELFQIKYPENIIEIKKLKSVANTLKTALDNISLEKSNVATD